MYGRYVKMVRLKVVFGLCYLMIQNVILERKQEILRTESLVYGWYAKMVRLTVVLGLCYLINDSKCHPGERNRENTIVELSCL